MKVQILCFVISVLIVETQKVEIETPSLLCMEVVSDVLTYLLQL